jgi:hypothetical protein
MTPGPHPPFRAVRDHPTANEATAPSLREGIQREFAVEPGSR